MNLQDMMNIAKANVERRRSKKREDRLAELHRKAVKRRKLERKNRLKGRR